MPESHVDNPSGNAPEEELDPLELGDEEHGDSPPSGEEPLFEGPIPPELQAVADGYKKAFTKKTEALAQIRKDAESSLQKAAFWDRIVSDPRYIQALAAVDAGISQGASAASDDGSEGEVDELAKVISPIQDRIQKLEARERELQIQHEKDQFLSTHPDWEQLVGREGMEESWKKNPYASMEDAFQAAVGRKVLAKRAAAKAAKQAPAVESPASNRGSYEEPGEIASFEQAVEAARRELGLNRR